MKNSAPTIEFVEDPVEITGEASLRSAEEGLGMSLRLGRELDRFVLRVGTSFSATAPAATTV